MPRFALFAGILLLGALTANTGAAAACGGFPLCNGQIVLSGGALSWIHWTHRLFAYVLLGYAIWWAVRTRTAGAYVVLGLVSLQAAVAAAMLVGTMFGPAPASAAQHEVKMLNKGAEGPMVFEPALLKIAPGDTVRFLATDKGHNAISIKGMTPEGATPFAGKMNEEIVVTFDTPGVYGFECKPHYGMGMVGLVVVGEPVNVADAQAVPQKGKAKKRFEQLFENVSQ